MRQQIARLSPHQNGKVFGALMGLSTLVFVVPMLVVLAMFAPSVDQNGNPITFPLAVFALFPVAYFVFGYLGVAWACFVYNFLFKYLGGIEFESKGE